MAHKKRKKARDRRRNVRLFGIGKKPLTEAQVKTRQAASAKKLGCAGRYEEATRISRMSARTFADEHNLTMEGFWTKPRHMKLRKNSRNRKRKTKKNPPRVASLLPKRKRRKARKAKRRARPRKVNAQRRRRVSRKRNVRRRRPVQKRAAGKKRVLRVSSPEVARGIVSGLRKLGVRARLG